MKFRDVLGSGFWFLIAMELGEFDQIFYEMHICSVVRKLACGEYMISYSTKAMKKSELGFDFLFG